MSKTEMSDEKNKELFEVYEVYGVNAEGCGCTYLVCRTLEEALGFVQSDMEDAKEGGKTTVVFRRYTQTQLDEVGDV